MTKLTRKLLRWAVESVEFHTRGLHGGTGQVRVEKITISEKKRLVKADIRVTEYGEETLHKNQLYNLDGLWTWINSLVKSI